MFVGSLAASVSGRPHAVLAQPPHAERGRRGVSPATGWRDSGGASGAQLRPVPCLAADLQGQVEPAAQVSLCRLQRQSLSAGADVWRCAWVQQEAGDGGTAPAVAGPRAADVVAGRVVWSTEKGAKIELLGFPGLTAYMPVRCADFMYGGTASALAHGWSMGVGNWWPARRSAVCTCAVIFQLVLCAGRGHLPSARCTTTTSGPMARSRYLDAVCMLHALPHASCPSLAER